MFHLPSVSALPNRELVSYVLLTGLRKYYIYFYSRRPTTPIRVTPTSLRDYQPTCARNNIVYYVYLLFLYAFVHRILRAL